MFVCLCRVVTDRQVEEAVRDGATTISDVGDHCDAGTGCGGCHDRLQEIIDKSVSSSEAATSNVTRPNSIVLPVLCG